MSEINVSVPDPLKLETRDPDAAAKNIATNGRLFCVLLWATCLLLWLYKPGDWLAVLAVQALLPIGLSCLVDAHPHSRIGHLLRGVAHGLPVGVVISLFIALLLN